jgi:hypothetical protein
MNRHQRRAAAAYRPKWGSGEWGVGTMICTQTIRLPAMGELYWFKCSANYSAADGIPADVTLHGPFRTEAEVTESQRLVQFGPQWTIIERGVWDPAWERPQ